MIGTPIDPFVARAIKNDGISSEKAKAAAMGLSSGQLEDLGPISASRAVAARVNEVRDEQGRQRFHGAFTGGFSAGYFNTVGSKEGWKPSTFVSSKSARGAVHRQNVRDFMDEEDEEIMGGSIRPLTDAGGQAGQKRYISETMDPFVASSVLAEDIPEELILEDTESPGITLMRQLGWREGRAIGTLRTGQDTTRTRDPLITSGATTELALKKPSVDEVIDALFREGTSRPVHCYYGIGYDPQSLRRRKDANEVLETANIENVKKQSQVTISKYILEDSKPTIWNKVLEPLGTKQQQRPNGVKKLHPLQRFTLDGPDDDDSLVYGDIPMENYEIASSKTRSALDVQREEQKQLQMQHRLEYQLENRGLLSLSKGTPEDMSGRLLQDASRNQLSKIEGAEQRGGTVAQSYELCGDGRPPLRGFVLSTRKERFFGDWITQFPPLKVPPEWDGMHHFREEMVIPYPIFAEDSVTYIKQQLFDDDLSLTEGKQKSGFSMNVNVVKNPRASELDSALGGKSLVFEEKQTTLSKEIEEGYTPTTSTIQQSGLPSVGSVVTRTSSQMFCNRLVFKRMNVTEPERGVTNGPANEMKAADNTSRQDLSFLQGPQTGLRPDHATASTVPSRKSRFSGHNPNSIVNVAEVVNNIPTSQASTLLPLVAPRPPTSIFQSLFGAPYSENDRY